MGGRACRTVGERRIGRLMKENGIGAARTKKYKRSTDSDHALQHRAEPARPGLFCGWPNQRWAGDISHIRTGEGWLCLAVIIDPYSRRVIGWALSDRINAIWQSGAADGHQPAPAATRLHPPHGTRLAILQPRLPEAPARALFRGLDERQGGIAMTTQRWRPSSRPSRPS